MGASSKMKSLDFYRKIPRDLTEGTLGGSIISLIAAAVMVFLFLAELAAFMQTTTHTSVVIDRSTDGDLLKLNFNISFPRLSCEFASVDVSDALGMNRFNLTKTVRKRPITATGTVLGDYHFDRGDIKHEELAADEALHEGLANAAPAAPESHAVIGLDKEFKGRYSEELDANRFRALVRQYPVLLVNFYAPWCPWSRRLQPVWEAAAKIIANDAQMVGVARLAQVDCTMNLVLCQEQHVQGFPSMRVFRGGSDLVTQGGHQDHASYAGDRTVDSIVGFIRGILPQRPAAVLQALPAGAAPQLADLRAAKEAGIVTGGHHPGCIIDGFVLVKKVPGSLFVTAHSQSHSFEHEMMNMTHHVKSFFIGGSLSAQKVHTLRRLLPGPLPPNWMDKLAGEDFRSDTVNTTHEHYLQVVRTTVVPLHAARGQGMHVDSFEYTAHSHSYQVEAEGKQLPQAKFSFVLSPMQVVIREDVHASAYHFCTTVSAIIGGVFTVASIFDSVTHHTVRYLRKTDLGKQF